MTYRYETFGDVLVPRGDLEKLLRYVHTPPRFKYRYRGEREESSGNPEDELIHFIDQHLPGDQSVPVRNRVGAGHIREMEKRARFRNYVTQSDHGMLRVDTQINVIRTRGAIRAKVQRLIYAPPNQRPVEYGTDENLITLTFPGAPYYLKDVETEEEVRAMYWEYFTQYPNRPCLPF